MDSKFEFSVDDDTRRLFAETLPPLPLEFLEFINGNWVKFSGVLGTIMDSRPITEAEAMLLTCGAMPL